MVGRDNEQVGVGRDSLAAPALCKQSAPEYQAWSIGVGFKHSRIHLANVYLSFQTMSTAHFSISHSIFAHFTIYEFNKQIS